MHFQKRGGLGIGSWDIGTKPMSRGKDEIQLDSIKFPSYFIFLRRRGEEREEIHGLHMMKIPLSFVSLWSPCSSCSISIYLCLTVAQVQDSMFCSVLRGLSLWMFLLCFPLLLWENERQIITLIRHSNIYLPKGTVQITTQRSLVNAVRFTLVIRSVTCSGLGKIKGWVSSRDAEW